MSEDSQRLMLKVACKNGQWPVPIIDSSLRQFTTPVGCRLRILVTFCSQAMIGSATTSRMLCLRVLLCMATLFAFCASNNVGLSFLPLPLVANQTDTQKPTDQEQLSPAPSHSDKQSVRVPITTYSQKREAKQPHSQPLAGTLKTGFIVSNDTRVFAEFNSAVQLYVSALALQPPGRAPPL